MKTRGRVIAGTAFLLAGSAISAAVAWTLPYLNRPSPPKPGVNPVMSWGAAPDRHGDWWMVSRRTDVDTDYVSWNWYGTEAEAMKNRDYYIKLFTDQAKANPLQSHTELEEFKLPSWSAIHHRDLDRFDPALLPSAVLVPADRVYTFWEVAQGWPFRCLRGTELTAVTAMADAPFQSIGLYGNRDVHDHPIALTPIPLGVLADSLIYGAVLASPFWGVSPFAHAVVAPGASASTAVMTGVAFSRVHPVPNVPVLHDRSYCAT